MMKRVAKTILAACALPLAATAVTTNRPPEITNVVASQLAGTKLVEITYDAADADGDKLKIRVEVSSDDGTTYSVPASSFSGDFGEGVTPGTGKKIVWDAGADWDGEYSDKMKVKVFALDGHGFPGMAFGDEVPPGGFLMGQDGGVEGNGPSRHVCIPWSYWLSKYEVTNAQYCDFLNAAYAMGFVKQVDTTSVYAADLPRKYPQSGDSLCSIGDSYGIRWNVNKFEVVEGRGNLPVVVTWYGAMTFARFYGYDLPTEAEWEMAARGPDKDDENEHCLYAWGNDDSFDSLCFTKGAEERLGDVGSFPETAYKLCDMMGNAAEWTRTKSTAKIENYPVTESLTNEWNALYATESRVVCGTYEDDNTPNPICVRTGAAQSSDGSGEYGFRVVRRYPTPPDSMQKLLLEEDFESWPLGDCSESYISASGWTWYSYRKQSWMPSVKTKGTVANASNKAICLLAGASFYLPDVTTTKDKIVSVEYDYLVDSIQKAPSMSFYSGMDSEHNGNHEMSKSVDLSFAVSDELIAMNWKNDKPITPAANEVKNLNVIQNSFFDTGVTNSLGEVDIYIDNIKVYVEEIVTE